MRPILAVFATAAALFSSTALGASESDRVVDLLERAVRKATRRPVPEDVVRATARELAADLPLRAAADLLEGKDISVVTERRKLRVTVEGEALTVSPTAVGDARSELLFVPLAPCRVFDTRGTFGGPSPIAAGQSRNFLVAGTAGFPNQGGRAGGCGVPIGNPDAVATAVAINLVAVGPAGPGHLLAYAYGTPAPSASAINYANVAGLNIANGIIVPIAGGQFDISDMTITAGVSATHVLGDVTGYFTRFPVENLWSHTSTTQTAAVSLSSGSCVQVQSCTVNAPSNGTVHVTGTATTLIQHTNGVVDVLSLTSSAYSATCSVAPFIVYEEVPSSYPTSVRTTSLPINATFTVNAGSHTFYVNAVMTSGASAGDQFSSGSLMCTFLPGS